MTTSHPVRLSRIPLGLTLAVGASGAAALGLQMVWTRMFALGLGQELPSTLGVITAFFGGLAVGSRWGGRALDRLPSPGIRCAVLEALTALWALATVLLVPWVAEFSWQWLGPAPGVGLHWVVSLLLPGVVLFPATVCLGAMMPAMERLISGFRADGLRVGPLYAVNTLGAVVGVLGSVLWVQRRWGLSGSVIGFAGLQCLCAVLFWWTGRGVRSVEPVTSTVAPGGDRLGPSRLRATLWLSGLLGIGFEVLATRLLSQVFENTVFTYAVILAAYLLFTALGGALQNRFAPKASRALGWLLPGVALSVAIAGWVLRQTPLLVSMLRGGTGNQALPAMVAEFLVASSVVALPALAMGILFASLISEAGRHPRFLGVALSWNLIGSALAPAVMALGLIPALGTRWSWILLGLGYLTLIPGWRRLRWVAMAGWAVAAVALMSLPKDIHLQTPPPGGRIVTLREGPSDTVTTVVQSDGHRILRINQRFTMGGTASALAERRHGHLPLLLHPEPRRALFLGVGTGISFSALDAHLGLVAEGIELVPEVAEVMPEFASHNAHSDRLTVRVADARRFVRASTQRYDVVIADLFHPARDGAAGLYTREHFQAIRDRLSNGGLFCQWLPLFQLDADGLRMITATFLEVFPEASALLLRLNADTPVIGLIGGQRRHLWSPEALERRLNQPSLREALKPMALAEVLPVMGTWFANAETLKTYSQSVGINTDDHPFLLFDAPRTLGPVPSKGQALLSELLDVQRPFPQDLCAGRPADECRRFRAYLEARDAHLRGLIAESQGRPEAAEQGFLRSVVLSADFTPGYAQLITRASLRAHSDPNGARRLLNLLIEARPERTVARDLKARLGL